MTDAKLRGLEERFAEVKGVRMRYFVGGSGPPVVLVHGLGGAASNWTELAPLLAGRHRLLVPSSLFPLPPPKGRSTFHPLEDSRGARWPVSLVNIGARGSVGAPGPTKANPPKDGDAKFRAYFREGVFRCSGVQVFRIGRVKDELVPVGPDHLTHLNT